MVRFLVLCIVFFALYVAFGAVGEYDYPLKFSMLEYQVETTIFTFASIFILVQLLVLMALKLVFVIFDLPSIIKNSWHQRNLRNANRKLLRIYSELLMGNRENSVKMARKIMPNLDDENKEFINLILAEGEGSLDQKIQYLREIVDKKNYSIYAAKKLASLFFSNSMYMQAEEYAVKAWSENDADTEVMMILIQVYDKLKLWSKMIFIVSKLQRANSQILDKHAKEVASYYLNASKASVASGRDSEAMSYVESALELKPDYIEALNLFMELSVNSNNSSAILKILKSAFSARPCFEIAEMYAKCSRSSVDVIYGTLASIAKPSENQPVFLALAAYLGLEDRVREIKSPKLIGYEGN